MTSSFEVLLTEFSTSKGIAMSSATFGLEVECEGFQIAVLQHPLHDDRVLCEVVVLGFDDEPPGAVTALALQINEAARFEHDWVIVMDGDYGFDLTTSAPLHGMSVAALEALMLDGVERAQLLKSLLQDVAAAARQAAAQPSVSASAIGPDAVMIMRG